MIVTCAAATPVEARKAGAPAKMRAMLAAHNQRRAEHCARPLVWSKDLELVARRWADHLTESCALRHSGNPQLGENLAAGTSGHITPKDVMAMWYGEVKNFDFARGGFSMQTGHFTQVVWAGTRRVGCAKSVCKGLDIWVCNYDPPGNVRSQYRQNVLPTSCRK